jgi:hypothetical protein
MLKEESLTFAIALSGSFWSKRPQFSIWIDENPVLQSELPDTQLHTFNFTHHITDGDHALKIRLENKQDSDTVVEDNKVINDMLLNINDISINNISLGNLLWSAEYQLDEPHEYQGKTITQLDNCVNLGWNGTYILKFSSPYYIWLLEKL